jgi:hypothetical protein
MVNFKESGLPQRVAAFNVEILNAVQEQVDPRNRRGR